ncbi:MAG: DUF309 domain-containing protein [Dehalococcoidia bacterium]|nr:DUF309 domain-containing protein [Dehalococcoidia bacterium]
MRPSRISRYAVLVTTPGRRWRHLTTKTVTVPASLQRACAEFNSGRFFECHETLEEVWQEETGPVRDLYKGLIQVAAAYVHVSRGNATGALRLFATALAYLRPYRPAGAMGFAVEAICTVCEQARTTVAAFGPGRHADLDVTSVPLPTYRCDAALLSTEARRWSAWGFDAEGNAREMEITVID